MFGGDQTVVMVMLVMTNVRVEVVIINTHLYAGDSYERLVYYKGLSINQNI